MNMRNKKCFNVLYFDYEKSHKYKLYLILCNFSLQISESCLKVISCQLNYTFWKHLSHVLLIITRKLSAKFINISSMKYLFLLYIYIFTSYEYFHEM